MFALNKILPVLGLALMLASGAANAIPHPQFGDAATFDSRNAAHSLEQSIKNAVGAIQLNINASPDADIRTSG